MSSLFPATGRFVARRSGADLVPERAPDGEFGPLSHLVADPLTTDVFVNGPGGVWVDRGAGLARVPAVLLPEDELRALAVRLLSLGGRHIDEATPTMDARLHDGIRVHAVLPPISPTGTLLSIRLPRVERMSLDSLYSAGFFSSIPERESMSS